MEDAKAVRAESILQALIRGYLAVGDLETSVQLSCNIIC
jgi:hypothetical protein